MKLADVVHDKISGFRGVAARRVEHLHGRIEWQVTPLSLNETSRRGIVGTDAQPVEPREFDEDRLEPLEWSTSVAAAGDKQ
jgi:hypothetical protein